MLASEDVSFHDRIVAYRELNDAYAGSGRSLPGDSGVRDAFRKALEGMLPWKEDDLTAEDIEYLSTLGYMKNKESMFGQWVDNIMWKAQTLDEQLRGIRNISLFLSRSRGVDGFGTAVIKRALVKNNPRKTNAPAPRAKEKKAPGEMKYIILERSREPVSLEIQDMLKLLSPDMIPASDEEIDVAICLDTAQNQTGTYTNGAPAYTTTQYVRAYDFRTGKLLKEIGRVKSAPPQFIDSKRQSGSDIVDSRETVKLIKKYLGRR